MDQKSKAENTLIKQLRKTDKHLSDADIVDLLVGFERFIKVVTKIRTEPQAQFQINEYKTKGGKILKRKSIRLNIDELRKVRDKSKKNEGLSGILKQIFEKSDKDQYGR
ncbi:MAG: hypothetical protein COU65_04750 [Candidatus Pacebacteria bacterium CG10_big_fil_rev_8_21_14_0_10_42_12]|nr:hypothetical protein [Candidatus Paceibacterota bacterium]PIR62186.1 MAG: hypothetical protein COU65_04750 [Candidatus Pacebacteria bacterium CG10_big_fil_rev_8_21_14_0_10_42_12]